MKGIIRFSLNNKFALWIITIIIVVAGLYAGLNMKQETLPNLEIPILQVTTVYPGAAPGDVVDNVSKPMEQRIKNLNGVKNVNSTSMANVSNLVVEYDYNQDMDKAASEVQAALTDIKLPQGAQQPKVNRISLNTFPVISLSITVESKSAEELTKIMEEKVGPALKGLPGVFSADISGQQLKEVQIKFDTDKMNSLGLTIETVKGIVQGSAVNVPLGLFELERTEKNVVVDGNVRSIDELNNMAIPVVPSAQGTPTGAMPGGAATGGMPTTGATPGAPATPASPPVQGGVVQAPTALPTVQLKDIAKIELIGKAESISRTNGKPSIGIQVVKAADANTVDVVNEVKRMTDKLKQEYPGMNIVTMMDQGKPIEESVATMLNKALFGALFAVIIIMLFLKNFRTTIISIVSIPLSLLIGILLLKQMDITLNMMTLGAMTVAIGRVVDDSIVVIENIYRRMSLPSEKLKGKELILDATREMFVPILSSTIVTIAVFLPLGLVSGMVGELFLPFALTMVFALLASLLVAITLVPMLGHSMFKNGLKGKAHSEKPGAMSRGYRSLLNWSLNHKFLTFITAIVLLVGSFFLVPTIGVSFLPEEEEKYAMITYTPAPGELLSDVEKKALEAEKFVLNREGVTDLQYSVGGQNPMSPGPSKSALFFVLYNNDVKDFATEKKNLVEDLKKTAPGDWKEMDFGGGTPGGNKLSLTVYGDNYEDIKAAITQIQDTIKNTGGFEKIDNSLSKSYGQYTLVANQKKLSELGLTAGQVAMKLMPERERPVLTKIKEAGKEYEVYVEVDKTQFQSIKDIENTTISSPLGKEVPIKDVVTVKEGESPNTITRKNDRMYAEVSANVLGADVTKASNNLQTAVDALKLPDGVQVDFGGVTEDIQETFTQLGLAMAAAVAIVYLVLVITFGGALAPLAILFSLPFAIIGGLVGLWITHETISVSVMMGALMLIGIVVTNAIVLLDRVIEKEKEGLSTREALLEAAGTRLRPILMTALATIGALFPLALGFEGAGIISKGLGITVIGGLTSSTFLTLLIVPVVYEFFMKFRKKQREEVI